MDSRKSILLIFFSFFLTFGLSIYVQVVYAAWKTPTIKPPSANISAPINDGFLGQSKSSGLVVKSSTAGTIGLLVPYGNIGVGGSFPVVKADIYGEIRPGNTNTGCTTTNEGAIRFNAPAKTVEFCNGTTWLSFTTP